jgi:hypothetical protein
MCSFCVPLFKGFCPAVSGALPLCAKAFICKREWHYAFSWEWCGKAPSGAIVGFLVRSGGFFSVVLKVRKTVPKKRIIIYVMRHFVMSFVMAAIRNRALSFHFSLMPHRIIAGLRKGLKPTWAQAPTS